MMQKLREDLENKLSSSLATMEQELRKCIFDERGSGLVYFQCIQEEQVILLYNNNYHYILFMLFTERISIKQALKR